MSPHRSLFPRLILGLSLLAPITLMAGMPTWHAADGVREGRLSAVYGSAIVVAKGDAVSLIGLDTLTDDETKAVAAFLREQPADTVWKNSRARLTKTLTGKLQTLSGGKLVRYDTTARTAPQVYLIYFSAGWCPPCHRFTPELVQHYSRWRTALGDKFELVFVSWDRSSSEQESYIREFQMPWPVLEYVDLDRTREVTRWAGKGIPCLVALSPNGELLCHTYVGTTFEGPDRVVDYFDRIMPLFDETRPEAKRARHRLAVLQHLERVGAGMSRVKPYVISIDTQRLGEIAIPESTVHLDIDEHGRVTNLEFGPEIGPVLAGAIQEDVRQWLFLPAVKEGKPVATSVRVPIAMERPAAPATQGAANSR